MSEPKENPANAGAGAGEFADWIGRRETVRETANLSAAEGMFATLDRASPRHASPDPATPDRDSPAPRLGDPLPPLWHWMFFAPKVPPADLGPDGHPSRGLFLPPVPLPRRMFAGARITFHAPIPLGAEMTRESEIINIVRKQGRSGELVFVTQRHRISTGGAPAIEEEQDIVYRDIAAPAQTPTAIKSEPGTAQWRRAIAPDPVLLFRYSALTFNGHRIHYDRDYVTGVERYPGLVVHGPLTATLLMQLATDATGRPAGRFAFQGKRPLFDTAPFEIFGRMEPDGESCALWAADPEGNVAMTASVGFAG